METENTVSIWIGNFESKSQLDEFLTLISEICGDLINERSILAYKR